MSTLIAMVMSLAISAGFVPDPVAVAIRTESHPENLAVQEPDPWPDVENTPSDANWEAIAGCESNNRWDINTGNGFYGGLQFTLSSWQGVGGEGYPHQASKDEQIYRADLLWLDQGWPAWPACSRLLGFR